MSLRGVGLFLESIVFTILVPGTVTILIPAAILGPDGRALPQPWRAAQFAALVPLALGAAIYFRCLWEFVVQGRGIPAPVDHPKQLVITGLYRYVRNPMYVGVLSVLAGEALFFQSGSLLVFTIVWFAWLHINVIFYEERTLRRKFGDSYTRYLSMVPRWIPR